MAATKLISYENLQTYDGLIKQFINTTEGKSIHTILYDSTSKAIKFYKKENATLADTADYSINIPADLDGSATIATVTNGVVTLKAGIVEADGVVSNNSDADITLAKVATRGEAVDVSTEAITDGDVSDPQTLYAAGTVQGTLESIARDLNNLTSESVVTVEKQQTAETGYFATYVVKQNNAQVGDKINIPKDYLVKSATVETVTVEDVPYEGAEVGDKYIDFTVNVYEGTGTESHIYIPVDDLMAAVSGGTTTVANEYELQVSVSDHNVITATLNNIYAQKVQYVPTSATTVLTSVTTVKGALDAIDTLIQNMDADIDAGGTAAHSGVFVVSGVTETNGVVTGVDSVEVEPAGTTAAAIAALDSNTADATSTVDTGLVVLTEVGIVDGLISTKKAHTFGTAANYADTAFLKTADYTTAQTADIEDLFD